jgi:peroxin-1
LFVVCFILIVFNFHRCDGYSGADLQALMYNAQLLAAHDSLQQIKVSMFLYFVCHCFEPFYLQNSDHSSKLDVSSTKSNYTITMGNGSEVPLSLRVDIAKTIEPFIVNSNSNDENISIATKTTTSTTTSTTTIITKHHIECAFRDLRPSISDVDRAKFDRIYDGFRQSDRNTEFKAGIEENEPRQTLM